MSFLSNISQQVNYIYESRAEAVYAAAQAVAASYRNNATLASALAASGAGRTTAPAGLVTLPPKRTFTLALYAANKTSGSGLISSLSTVTAPPTVSVAAAFKPMSTITFDVFNGPVTNAFAQRINYEQRARQSLQQSLAGYHLNEFGLAPGSLDIESIVVWSTAAAAQVQLFFDQLANAKMSAPNSSDSPFTLKFFDSYLGRAYTITQDGVRLSQDVENPNRGILSIQATILFDYSAGAAPVVPLPDPTLAVAQASAQAALNSLQAVGGSTIGVSET